MTAERSADRAGTRKRPDTAPIDELRAMQLYNDGLDDIAMADALGVTAKRVQNWRLRMHLKRPNAGNAFNALAQEFERAAVINARKWAEAGAYAKIALECVEDSK